MSNVGLLSYGLRKIPSFIPQKVLLGSNGGYTRASTLSGGSDSNLITIAMFYQRVSGTGGSSLVAFQNGASTERLLINDSTTGSGLLSIVGDSEGSNFLNVSSIPATGIETGTVSILISLDMSDSLKRHVYVNNAEVGTSGTWTTYINNDFEFSAYNNLSVGHGSGGADTQNMGEIWIQPGVYTDFSIAANRAKFVNPDTLKPVFLGSTGQIPTGSSPLVYLTVNRSQTVDDFGTNKGTGGAFTKTGTVTGPTAI